jgi:UDPglucose--hexose-1-phosphate uridylyltransferase
VSSLLLADGRVRRSTGVLADGREIFYYDDSGPFLAGRDRHTPDTRDLPPAAGGSTIRRDPLTGEMVAIASHRNDRTFLPPADACPLCPTRPGRPPTELPPPDYDVAVFENRFPSFSRRPVQLVDESDRPAPGHCDVVVFTADHEASLASLPPSRARTVIEAWADRTAALSELGTVRQVFPFENRGREIGVTLGHPHGQIYGYPYLPPRTRQLLQQAAAHRSAHGTDLLADVLAAERAGPRTVLAGEHWSAYVPAAARWPVEVHLAPHRDVPDLAALDDAERDELAHVYLDLLNRLDRYFDGVDQLPYIAAWHQAPLGEGRELGRLHLRAFSVLRAPGRLKYLAGSESAMGAWISDAVPERIAARLRDVG